jgi:hypothetical protein
VHDVETIATIGGVDDRHLDRGRRMTGIILKRVARKRKSAGRRGAMSARKMSANRFII